MTSTERLKRRLAAGTASMLVAAMGLMAAPAAAQENAAEKAKPVECGEDQILDAKGQCVTEKAVEEVMVTGSRLRRTSSFSSISAAGRQARLTGCCWRPIWRLTKRPRTQRKRALKRRKGTNWRS